MIGQNAYPSEKKTAKRGPDRRRAGFAVLLLSTTALTGIVAGSALADDITWTGATNFDWVTNTNWDTNLVPTNADDVFINTTTGFPGIGTGSNAAANDVTIGTLPVGGLLQISGGGTLTANGLFLGLSSSSTGAVNVSGAGSTLTAANALVGVFGPGSMTFTLGSTGTIGSTYIGDAATGSGIVTVDFDSTVSFGSLYVGFEGTGALSLETGGDVISDFAFIGTQVGSEGAVHVEDLGSTWTITNGLSVGYFGQGDLEISNGGVVTFGTTVLMGVAATGVGTTTVVGAGSQLIGGAEIIVGDQGAGTLTIEDQGYVSTDLLSIGEQAGSTGTVYVEDAGSTLDIGASLVVGQSGTGTLNINNGGQVTVGNNNNTAIIGTNPGSSGTVNVAAGGVFFLGNNALAVGGGGTGALNISSAGAVVTSHFSIGDSSTGSGTVTVSDIGTHLLSTGDGAVGYDGNGMLYIANGGLVSLDNGAGTLNVAVNAGSVGEVIIGDDGVPAGTLDAAVLQFGAGTGFLTFNHTNTDYTFATPLMGTGTLFHAAGTTKLTGDSSAFTGITNVNGGGLYVNNLLGGAVNVSDGGTLGGSGTLSGALNVNSGGTIAPGNSIGTLNVASATFNAGSTHEVELNDGGNVAGVNNDLLNIAGGLTINGGTVHVTPENGSDNGTTYVPDTTYTIITVGSGINGTFDAVTDDFAFLDFTLGYGFDVLLTSSIVTSFCLPGMTDNQCATADGVFSLGAGSLLTAVANLSDAEAPLALDQLSGEIHALAKTALIEDSRFVREAALSRLDAAFKPIEQGDRPGVDDAAFWGRAFGSWGSWDGDGNAAGMDRDIGGFFLGADALVAGDVRLGVMGGYGRPSFDADGRASSGAADTFTLGAYGGGAWNGYSLKGGAAYSWHSVEAERSVAFTGFSDNLSASYDARTAQIYGEAAYELDAGPARFEPFANLAYVDLSTDGFSEDGGEAALTAAGDDTSATFTTLGLRAETSVAIGGRDATLRGMLGWRHAFGDLTPEQALAFAGGDAFTVAGVPVAEDALALGAGFDVEIGESATLGVSYNGQFGSGFADHGVRADLAVGF